MNSSFSARVGAGAVVTAAAGLLLATALSQHPNRSFDRLRRFDRLGLVIPNWRFFAPTPATEDFHVLHRTLEAHEVETPWETTLEIAPRRPSQLVWFPTRRREKAIFDITTEILLAIPQGDDAVLTTASYQTLVGYVRKTIASRRSQPTAPEGYQFMIARHRGFDESAPADFLLISPFIPWDGTPEHLSSPGTLSPHRDSRTRRFIQSAQRQRL